MYMGSFALMNARAESQTLWPSALQTCLCQTKIPQYYKCKHLINSSSYQKHVEHGQLGSLWFDNWAVYRSHHSLVLGLYMSAFVRGQGDGRRIAVEIY
jgi:hypothetical protein